MKPLRDRVPNRERIRCDAMVRLDGSISIRRARGGGGCDGIGFGFVSSFEKKAQVGELFIWVKSLGEKKERKRFLQVHHRWACYTMRYRNEIATAAAAIAAVGILRFVRLVFLVTYHRARGR